MSATIDLTESQALTVLRSFLLLILPAGVDVLKAQINRVAEPNSLDFVMMTVALRERLATNVTTYTDSFPGSTQTRATSQSTRLTVQLDIHGPASAENSQIVTTLFRDEYASAYFDASGYALAPLYTSEPRQAPFMNGENQLEMRWTVDLLMQMTPAVTTAQEFAGAVVIASTSGILNVDAAYPPTGAEGLAASFYFTPNGATGFTFTSSSTGFPDTFSWDFRSVGAANSTAPSAAYDYGAIGTYFATLTVTKGLLTSSVTRAVFVGHLPSILLEAGAGYVLAEDGSHILLEA